MNDFRFLLDEDVRPLLADVLRQRGFDAVHVLEADRSGRGDREQLEYATAQGRFILTHNIRDYLILDREYRSRGAVHGGILVSDQVPFRELLGRVLKCLSRISLEEIANRVIWLHDFK